MSESVHADGSIGQYRPRRDRRLGRPKRIQGGRQWLGLFRAGGADDDGLDVVGENSVDGLGDEPTPSASDASGGASHGQLHRLVLHRLVDLLPEDTADAAATYLSFLVEKGTSQAVASVGTPTGVRVLEGGGGPEAHSDPQAVVVLIGPCEGLMGVASLVREMEDFPGLEVEFRLFKEGVYRVDGEIADLESLAKWLRDRPDVVSVALDDHTVHVLPKQAER